MAEAISAKRRSAQLTIALSFFAIALLFGGGGSPSPFAELLVQIAALIALGVSLWRGPVLIRPPQDRALWAGAVLLILIPAVQLIPVPPVVWMNLPGRQNVVAAITFIGRAHEWRPMSIAPARTVASLLSLIPPLAMMWFASQLRTKERTMLLWVVAGVGLFSAILATLQLTTGAALIFYQPDQPTAPPGIMASRNAQADLMLFAMLATIALAAVPHPRVARPNRLMMAAVVLAVLVTALVLSGSRAGLVMLVIPLIAAARLWFQPGAARFYRDGRHWLVAGAVALAVIAGAILVARDNAMVGRTLARFEATSDGRFSEIWPDAFVAAKVEWPAGSGMGTFVPAFESVESLEVVNESEPNRAHNDYLEFVVEAGLAAVVLLGIGVPVLIWRIYSTLKITRGQRGEPVAVFAAAVLLVVALHSLVDYPLRAMTIAAVAGFAAASLSRREPGNFGVEGRWLK